MSPGAKPRPLSESLHEYPFSDRREFRDWFDGIVRAEADVLGRLLSAGTLLPESDLAVIRGYLDDLLTVPANLTRVPAISLPWLMDAENDLPLGVQLMGRCGLDEELLGVVDRLSTILNR